jgi:hypothetical protein
VSCYVATPLIVALSPGHSDITRFCPWSPITTGNHLDRTKQKNSKSCSDDWHHWRCLSMLRHVGPILRRGTARQSLHEWWSQLAHVRYPVAQLLI